MTSAVPDASVVSHRSARTDRASRPTGLRAETSGFAAMMDEASPEPRASANQTRPSDRVQAADKAQAASEAPVSNEPAAASDESAPAPDEAAPASTETGPALAAVTLLPGEIAPVVALEAGTEETLAAATDLTPEAAIADVPLAPPVTPLAEPQAAPATAVPVQAAPEPALPDLTAQPSQATAAPAIASAADSTKPVAASPAPGQAAAVAPAIKMATTVSADGSGEKIVDPADTAPAQSGTAASDPDAHADAAAAATLADGPKQPTQARTSADTSHNAAPARPEATPDKPAPQPDAAAKPDDTALATKPNIDASSQVQLAVPAHSAATHAATPHAMPVSAAQPVPADAIAVEIASQARAGNSRFEIRLDPPELGRIDVRLDVDRDGNVKSRLVIERADTYDLLRRDQSTLERALQQAGLKTSDHALEFSLRDQGFAQQRNADDESRGTRAMIHETEVAPSEAANGYARLLGARGGIDIRV